MADDLEKTSEYKNRYEEIKAAILRFLEKEEDPEVKQEYEKSLAELINFGGKFPKEKSEGGLLDEGGEVDEESGNDVPIGGTKEGVRDDIPAMLSEGEFVFPEDVTRYHGLEKLMTLRQEAKMGLKKMEAMGQMGNSEEATIPDDLPFSMDDLLVVVTGDEEESKKKDDDVIKAQAGTFVPATQQQNNMGISGFQQSMYGSQPVTGQPVTPPFMPPSPAPTPPPVGGYTPPTVLAEPVDRPDFVPDVSDQYKPVKYINATSGDTMMINEYQGNPVSAVPAGFVRYDEYIAGGGKEPEDTGIVGTGVETTKVSGTSGSDDDERKAGKKLLDDMKTNKERQRVKEYNKVFDVDNIKNITDKNNPDYISNDMLIDAYKDQMQAENVGAGLGFLGAGVAGLLPRLGRGKVNEALNARFGKGFDSFKDNPEFQKLTKDITRGSVLKEAGSDILKGFKDSFSPDFYKDYTSKYSLSNYGPADKVQGYIKGASGNNLNVRQQQQFDNAVDRGDTKVANHFALVARGNNARDAFAKENSAAILAIQNEKNPTLKDALISQLKGKNRNHGGMTLSGSSVDQIIKYGSSINTAINEGRAEKGGFLQPVKVIKKGTIGSGSKTSTTVQTKTKDDSGSTSNEAAQIQASIQKKKKDDSNKNKTKKAISKADKNLSKNRPKGTSFRKSSSGRGFTGGFKQGGFIERK